MFPEERHSLESGRNLRRERPCWPAPRHPGEDFPPRKKRESEFLKSVGAGFVT